MTDIKTDSLTVADSADLTKDGRLDPKKVLAAYGYADTDFTFDEDPPLHYYEPEALDVLFGIPLGEFTYEKTSVGTPMTSVVVRLTQVARGVNTMTKEVELLQPGDLISVAERSAFKKLAQFIGRECAVLCVGKQSIKGGKTFWNAKVAPRNEPPASSAT
jgi:hypothetical protein